MFVTNVHFRLKETPNHDFDPQITAQTAALNALIDQWRDNGQIIGREIPLFLQQDDHQKWGFTIRVICPEAQSLHGDFNSAGVNIAYRRLAKCGLILDSFNGIELEAEDLNADVTSPNINPPWQMLYTTYLKTCSPVHSGADLAPIPLYRLTQHSPALAKRLIKWQENWQAYDQLQMNAAGLEPQILWEMGDIDSPLTRQGRTLCGELEKLTGTPTYYYLYRVGGDSLDAEQQRCCPGCRGEWRLPQPLFEMFHFKCDECRLISNLSWNFL